MLDLSRISLFCLDTRYPDLAVHAMQHCLAQARFGEVVLLTRADYVSPDPRIAVRPVPELRSIEDYSHFMVKELGAHFRCPHVLVVQWDGFILDAAAWNPAFLDFDYIGAPWPYEDRAVGNGGFSLRSRKLVDALQDPEISILQPEDDRICRTYHELLTTRHGIRFAPVELARRFSFEMIPADGPTFGFHGFDNLDVALPDDTLLDFMALVPPRVKLSLMGRGLLKDLIRAGKYRSALDMLGERWRAGSLQQRLDAIKLRLRLEIHRLRHG